jgi:hypothetical protein
LPLCTVLLWLLLECSAQSLLALPLMPIGPISDNAGGTAEMAGMSHRIYERTLLVPLETLLLPLGR